MVDMCNAMGITPVITTHCQIPTSDYADLVEYCWGDESTLWGKQRILDGHKAPYNVTYFELGNEMYNTNYVEQVKAMEERATKLGMAKTLHYMFPDNQGPNGPDSLKAAALGLGDHLVVDIHDGATGGVEAAEKVFNSNFT